MHSEMSFSCLRANSAKTTVAVRSRPGTRGIAAVIEDDFRLPPGLPVKAPQNQEGTRLDVPVEGEGCGPFAEDMEDPLGALVVGHSIGVTWVRLDGEWHPS